MLPELSFLIQGLGAEFSKSYYYYNQAGHMCQCLVCTALCETDALSFSCCAQEPEFRLGERLMQLKNPKPWQSISLITVADNLNIYAMPSSTCTGLFYVIGWIPLLSLFKLRKQAC